MEFSDERVAFLLELQKGARRALASMDAGMIGPLIRANLVRWDDDPSTAARLRDLPGSTFTRTEQGQRMLAEYEARRGVEQRER